MTKSLSKWWSMKVELSKADLTQVEHLLADVKNGSKKALTVALNKTLVTVNAQAAKTVGTDLALTAKRIKKDFRMKKASYSNIAGSFSSKGVPIGLASFGAKQTKKGVSFKVKRKGKRTLIKHAFLAKGKSNFYTKQHVWWRGKIYKKPVNPKMKYGALPRKYRFPESSDKKNRGIQRLTGPRIEDILSKSEILGPLEKLGAEKFQANLGTQIDSILRRHNG